MAKNAQTNPDAAAADAAAAEKAAADAAAAEKAAADAAAAEKAAADAAAAEKASPVRVRVLVDCAWGLCNTLGQVPADQLDAAKDAGEVDDSPEALAAVPE